MSINYIYVCDEKKEWLDPYPLDAPHLFVWMHSFLVDPFKNHEYVEGWYGKSVQWRFLQPSKMLKFGANPTGMYKDVTKLALAEAGLMYPEWWERK